MACRRQEAGGELGLGCVYGNWDQRMDSLKDLTSVNHFFAKYNLLKYSETSKIASSVGDQAFATLYLWLSRPHVCFIMQTVFSPSFIALSYEFL